MKVVPILILKNKKEMETLKYSLCIELAVVSRYLIPEGQHRITLNYKPLLV